MATVTKLKAQVDNINLPILGSDGKLYSYYYGRYFNVITEKGYTPTSGEKAALEAFIQNGIDNGWIDLVKYFLPLIGSADHLVAATVPLIDRVGDYAMAEYDGTENFSNSFEVVGGKVKYYTRIDTPASIIKTPCAVASMSGGISFSGYIPQPEVVNTSFNDQYAGIKLDGQNITLLQIRYHEGTNGVVKNHQIGYLPQSSSESNTFYDINIPSKATIEELNAQGMSMMLSIALYKDNGTVKRLRSYQDANGVKNYTNTTPDTPFTYDDYSLNQGKMVFGEPRYLAVPSQKFGCLGVLDAPKFTDTLANSYNDAVFTLMAALGK